MRAEVNASGLREIRIRRRERRKQAEQQRGEKWCSQDSVYASKCVKVQHGVVSHPSCVVNERTLSEAP